MEGFMESSKEKKQKHIAIDAEEESPTNISGFNTTTTTTSTTTTAGSEVLSKIPTEEDFERVSEIPLKKIISGGQTGADRGALEAGYELGFETGGTAPLNYYTSKGKSPELGYKFHLKELELKTTQSKISYEKTYIQRSMKNIDDSDATIAFRLHDSAGTDKSIGYCLTKKWEKVNSSNVHIFKPYRPVLIITDLSLENTQSNTNKMLSFLFEHNVRTLNVCGHRDDSVNNSFTLAVKDSLINALICYRRK